LLRHRSYYPILYPLLPDLKALAHLTGGGFIETSREPAGECGRSHRYTGLERSGLFRLIQERGEIAPGEMFRVFNMGLHGGGCGPEKCPCAEKAIPEDINDR